MFNWKVRQCASAASPRHSLQRMDGWMDGCAVSFFFFIWTLTDMDWTEFFSLPQIPVASDQTAIDTCKAKAAPLEVEDPCGSPPVRHLFISLSSSPSSPLALQWGLCSFLRLSASRRRCLSFLSPTETKIPVSRREMQMYAATKISDTLDDSETNRLIIGWRDPPWLVILPRSTRITFHHLEINLTRGGGLFFFF